ncbi:bifunctional transcriptional activator/DNA repair enzyme AdaA [Marininema halotolerans]|uniref:AraC family transcriptional regulator, regulatory protein of adaptative response / methylphosphotriester-DNA alkyltransferase methyltransferase n=1 Tax=Marininema halotolerans TaxID=1155944 RepID=A0A1I6UG52_9BACL|nr:Ada metal-binding domain-containing protein [Marininema halotolerans]SFT00425.1 AraC family transcriptional regulator, regulatory protein of adaptative response / methylphosphotriester-DNA alkyltransferase methyltransferase [Marininema halotolerans]
MEDPLFQSVYETILQRDTRYDGQYYVGIVSTGIFCRPSCRSRTPKPENVRVYPSMDEARQAGFRPCKRCRPDHPSPHGPDAKLAQTIKGLIQQRYQENWTLTIFADELKISPYHLQRVFRRVTGTTPAKELLHTRVTVAKQLLSQSHSSITSIAKKVGYQNTSHFSAVFKKNVGCTPQEFRENGTGG